MCTGEYLTGQSSVLPDDLTLHCSKSWARLNSFYRKSVLLSEPYLCRHPCCGKAVVSLKWMRNRFFHAVLVCPFAVCDFADFCVMYVETDPPFDSVASPLSV